MSTEEGGAAAAAAIAEEAPAEAPAAEEEPAAAAEPEPVLAAAAAEPEKPAAADEGNAVEADGDDDEGSEDEDVAAPKKKSIFAAAAAAAAPAPAAAAEAAPKRKLDTVFGDSSDDDDDDDDGDGKQLRMAEPAMEEAAPADAAAPAAAAAFAESSDESDSDVGGAAPSAAPGGGGAAAASGMATSEALRDVFGDSSDDSDAEDFSTFQAPTAKESSKKEKKSKKKKDRSNRDDGDDDGVVRDQDDFDILKNMIKKKKKIGGKKRKNDDGEDIGSSRGADLVNVVKKKMAEAGERDEKMIKEGKPATKKLLLLPWVVKNMRTKPLMLDFLDQNILKEIAAWLAPDPDRKNTLPNIKIRDELLAVVDEVFSDDVDMELLKDSKLGKVMMSLLGHPKESPKNKYKIKKTIQKWSRRVHHVKDSMQDMTVEEREVREKKQQGSEASRKRRRSSTEGLTQLDGPKKKAGEAGFIQRARVPQPITRDYTVRPESKVEGSFYDDEGEDGEGVGSAKKQPKKKTTFQRMQQEFKTKGAGSQKWKSHHNPIKMSMNHV